MTRRGTGPAVRAALLLLLAGGSFISCTRRHRPVTTPAARPVPAAPAAPGLTEEGLASWYGGNDGFNGKPTASGDIFDDSKLTAAHRTLPLGTRVDVENLVDGRTVRVTINDRGPYVKGRVLDLSKAAAEEIGAVAPGVIPVKITVVRAGPVLPAVSPTGQWTVQVGSFASAYRAETLAAKIRQAGQYVYTEGYKGLTRVRAGIYNSSSEARAALRGLENLGYEGIVVPISAP